MESEPVFHVRGCQGVVEDPVKWRLALFQPHIVHVVVPEHIVVNLRRLGVLIEIDPRPDRELVAGVVAGVVKPVVVDARSGQVRIPGRIEGAQVGVEQPEPVDVVVGDLLVAVDAIDARSRPVRKMVLRVIVLRALPGAGKIPQQYVPP